MTEQNVVEGAQSITERIQVSLLHRHMKQVELAKLIGENPVQLNRAIHADMSPRSIEIRRKIYRVLDIKE